MAEFIEREALLKSQRWDRLVLGFDRETARGIVVSQPAADVVPVVHGRWIDRCVRDWRCSECGEKLLGRGYDGYVYKNLPNYCPNCGARMDGE